MELYTTFQRLMDTNPPSTMIDFGFTPPTSLQASHDFEFSPFLLVEKNLGVPANAIEPLMRYAHFVFFSILPKINLESLTETDLTELDRSSRCLLLLNPEIYSAWNARKKLLCLKSLSISEELALVDLVLSKHPKRPSAWTHRAWLLPKVLDSTKTLIEREQFLKQEIKVCNQAAQRHRMNYHAWTYRLKVVRDAPLQFKLHAFRDTRSYISSHISEHSAFAHALSVLEFLFQDTDFTEHDAQELFNAELKDAMRLIVAYPGHKSPWCYLQGLYLISLRNQKFDIKEKAFEYRQNHEFLFLEASEQKFPISEIDIADWLELFLSAELPQNLKLKSRLIDFGEWIIAVSKAVVASRGLEAEVLSPWRSQTENAIDFQLYLLLGVNEAEVVRKKLLRKLEEFGGWPEFLLKMNY
ncbi:Protein prenyltransferase alpha subunit repeat-containing protein 1 [Physocladia obscura]|uniref:Protein prenyltransferase alpha subunit repeat-containing protein 1 n=1 Tax=Physocladia obscura TaxID=109957 RepID=A0AAD5XID8_9FUNG|nr:Protein prenyltransferase alpha subunit repeat-containing protein 1 [Physocladia obscura]